MQVIQDYRPKPIPKERQTEVISVAVAVYNSDAFLERAIESILNQTYRNLEVILVDDGSTDGCPEICDRYAAQDSRVRVIHKKNGGLFSSRNVGIEQASGTYLAFVDGDDWLEPDMYEKMLSCLKEQEADLAVCQYRRIYRDGTVDRSTGRLVVMEGQEILEKYLEEEESLPIQNAAWNKLYKRSILGDLTFPPRWYEDMLYTVRLLNLPKRSVFLDQACYNYVCDRSTSIMNRGINPRIFTDLIPNLYDRSAYLRAIDREDLALLQDYSLYKRLMLFYTQVIRSRDPEKKEHLADLTKRLKEGKNRYPAIFSIPQANPNEYRKLKLFLISPALYRAAMAVNDRCVLPARQMLRKKKRKG